MADNERLIEIMADLLAEARDIKTDLRAFKDQSDQRMSRVEQQLGRVEEQQMKNNAAIGELRLSVMNLADRLEQLFQLERRVQRIEERLFPGGGHQQAA